MVFLALAILGSGVIPVFFRACAAWRVNLFWAIPVNYFTCIFLGGLLTRESLDPTVLMSQPWILFAVVQGIILAVNFYLLAHTAQRVGVAIASLASRLSVAIPSLLAFSLYGDSITVIKMAGLMAALLALYLCTVPETPNGRTRNGWLDYSPITLFVTFGCYFSILKYLQTYYLNEASYHSYVISGFFFAFISSMGIGTAKGLFTPSDFHLRHVGAGLILGVINYTAIYALLRTLAVKGWETSQIYPIYSVGVVSVATLLAFICFRERLSSRRLVGLCMGLAAVALLNR